jgi:hypothetical protein
MQRVKRADLKAAPYNPRTIDKHSRKKLKDKLGKAGLVMPLVWNKQTGNIVSGHQRINILDELEGKQDYELDVAVVDLDEKSEKELNIFLNNTSAMGSWDLDVLTSIFKESQDLTVFGFDPLDVQLLSNDDSLAPLFDESKRGEAVQSEAEITKIKEARKKFKERKREKDDAGFYVVLVFGNRAEMNAFNRAVGQATDEMYFDGRRLCSDFCIPIDKYLMNPSPEMVARAEE